MITLATLATDISAQLDSYRDQIQGAVFRDDLPMLGAQFAAQADAVMAFVADMQAQVQAALAAVEATVGATATAEQIVAEITANAALYPALAAQVRLDGTLQLDLASALADVEIDLAGGAIDLGSLGAGFAIEGGVDLAADVNASLSLLVDPDDGTVTVDVDAGAEFSLSVDGSLVPDGDLDLGFLTATSDGSDLSDGYDLDFLVDLTTGDGLTATLTGGARFGRQITTNTPSAVIPTISADFLTGFDFNVDLSEVSIEAGVEAFVGLYDITVNMGTIAEFLNSVLGQLADIANSFPLGDVIDILTAPIPVLDTIAPVSLDLSGDGSISALDFILAFGGENDETGFITAIQTVFDVLEVIKDLGDISELMDLGDLEISGEATASLETGFDISQFGATFGVDLGDSEIAVALADALGLGVQADYSIQIPLLTDPLGTIGALLFNGFSTEPVDLVTWDLPPMGFSVTPQIPFNVGPLAFFIGGKFEAVTDFAIGYDTFGFEPGGTFDVTQGFVINTATGGAVAPFLTLSFGMEAGGGVGVGVARVAIVGGVEGIIDLFLGGADANGDTRLDQFLPCLFDPISGRIVASLEVEVKVGIGPLSITERISIGETILAQFDFDPCDIDFHRDDYKFDNTGLARVLPAAGALRLNVGDFADQRALPGDIDTGATGEVFYVDLAPPEDDGSTDPDALAVSAYGIFDVFSHDGGFSEIRADGKSGDDRFTVAADVDVAVDFSGGAGSDSLTGGGVADLLEGNLGNDTLVGNDGDDSLDGGGGDDVLVGGEGGDTLDGGAGIDEADYSLSDAAVEFAVVGLTREGSGGDAEGDVLIDVELLKGSNFGDVLVGDLLEDSALQGLDGDDTLIGGSGDDLLAGGLGADEMFGGAGDDAVSYAFSDAAVLVDNNFGLVWGGEATGDQLDSIEIFQLTWQSDSFFGSQEFGDTVYGFNGNDWLDGGLGDDLIDAGEDNDTVIGNADGDTLDGGSGRDLLSFEDKGERVIVSLTDGTASTIGIGTTDTLVMTGVGNSSFEDVIGSSEADTIEGDTEGNLLIGLDGIDEIAGLQGNDTLIGGAGGDLIQGGAGFDLADYSGSLGVVNVSLATATGIDGDADGDVILGVEALIGTEGGDTLTGNILANDIDVGAFGGETDIVDGRGGLDRLIVNWSDAEDDLEVVKLSTGNGFVREAPWPTGAILVDFDSFESVSVTTGSGDDVIASIADGPAVEAEKLDHFTGDDYIATGAGDDTINAGSGADLVYAGANDDHVSRNKAFDAGTFLLDGGDGIDTLVLNALYDTQGITLVSLSALEENDGAAATIEGGGAVTAFEILAEIVTGSGDDVLTQLGDVDNDFTTGDGNDTVTLDYGDNVVHADAGTDTLILNYAGDSEHAIQRLISIGLPAPWSIGLNDVVSGIREHQGSYWDFERAEITGTENGDDLWGLSIVGVAGDVLDGRGGRDTLHGGTGDDTLIGGRARDELDGGNGDDLLDAGAAGFRDGVDTVTGGNGSDTFVLGDATGTHYGDLDQTATFDYALIADFVKADDVLQLAGTADDYSVDEAGGNSEIRLVATGELVAVVENVLNLRLDRGYVSFVDVTAAAAAPAAVANLTGGGGAPLAMLAPAARAEPFTIRNIGLLDPMIALLTDALDDVASGPLSANQVSVATEGDLAGIGFFENAPFGLEEGFVISSGNALDIADKNLADGTGSQGAVGGSEAQLVFEKIGATAGGSAVFRADLSALAGGLSSLTLADSLNLEGADSIFSGFDLDGLFLSSDLIEAVGGIVDVTGAQVLDLFDFSPAGTTLNEGTMRNPGLFTDLAGTVNGVIDQAFARLNLFDYNGNAGDGGAVSLGDGGSVTFQLTEELETGGPLYLYVAEAFDAGEELSGIVTATAADATSDADLSTDFGAAGAGGDRVVLSTEFTVDLDSGAAFDICDLFNIVIVSEELPEFGGAALADLIEVRVNGVNVAVLADGRQATLQNLAASPFGPYAPELSLNLLDGGALVNVLSADAYTSILRVQAPIFDGENSIEIVVADGADGLRDSAIFVSALTNDTVDGGAADDRLTGSSADDTLTGKLGNDTAAGGHGWDTYFYALGHIGTEVIDETSGSGFDTIAFGAAVLPEMLTFIRTGAGDDNLEIRIGGLGQTIRIRDQYAGDAAAPQVERILFADGTEIDLTGVLDFTGTTGDDTGAGALVGTVLSETLFARAGNDKLSGLAGDDTLFGGLGGDSLSGGDGDDLMIGGDGDDALDGGDGDDLIGGGAGSSVMAGGLGRDSFGFDTAFTRATITDLLVGAGGDVLVFDLAGQAQDFAAFLADARQAGDNVVYDAGTLDAERIVLRDVVLGELTADNFLFL